MTSMASKPSYRDAVRNIAPYVPGKPISEVKRELGISDVVKMASNENPLGPSPMVQQALRESVDQLHLYPDGYAYELRQALAGHLRVEAEQLVFGNGSDEVIRMIAETYFCPEDEVVMATPTFSVYRAVADLMGARPVEVPLQNHTHNLWAMAQAITDQTKAVFICNPNNPTGTIVSQSQLKSFLRDIPSTAVVVLDEAYYEYVKDESYRGSLELIGEDHTVIILRTFSKVYGLAGLRIGYGISDSETVQLLERVREPFNTNALAQIAALASLEDQAHVDESLAVNERGKAYLYRAFEDMGLEYVPSHTNFILVDVGRDCLRVFEELLAKGVIIRAGASFGYPTKIRVTVGTEEQNTRFVAALADVLATT